MPAPIATSVSPMVVRVPWKTSQAILSVITPRNSSERWPHSRLRSDSGGWGTFGVEAATFRGGITWTIRVGLSSDTERLTCPSGRDEQT